MAKEEKRREKGTGGISQRKDGLWQGRFDAGVKPDGKRDVKYVYAKSESECRRKLRDLIKEIHSTEYVSIQRQSFGSYIDYWLKNVKAFELKPRSYDRLEQTVNIYVKPYLGHIQLDAVGSDDVQKMIADLTKSKKSFSIVKKAYEAVNASFKWGMRCDPPKVGKNPASGVSLPNRKLYTQKQIPFYTADEAASLIMHATNKHGNGVRKYTLGAFVPLLINTGLRMSELLSLKWETDIDLENRTLNVHTNVVLVKDREKEKGYKLLEQKTVKTEAGQDRSIPLNQAAMDALRDLKQVTGHRVWVMTTRNNTQVGPRQLDKTFRRIAIASGMPKEKIYGVHALRHTFATLLLSSDVDIKTVSELLGHSDVKTTYNTYIHVIKSQKAKALDKLPELTTVNLNQQ